MQSEPEPESELTQTQLLMDARYGSQTCGMAAKHILAPELFI